MSAGPASPAVAIRRAVGSDLDAIVAITDQAYVGYVELLGAPPFPMTENYQPRIAAGEVWMAEADGARVGLIVIEPHHDHLMIFSVAVEPKAHGRGIGRALMTLAEARAVDSGVPEVRLYTNALMARNLSLYARLGYREVRRRPHPRRPAFTIVDMAKRVDGSASKPETGADGPGLTSKV